MMAGAKAVVAGADAGRAVAAVMRLKAAALASRSVNGAHSSAVLAAGKVRQRGYRRLAAASQAEANDGAGRRGHAGVTGYGQGDWRREQLLRRRKTCDRQDRGSEIFFRSAACGTGKRKHEPRKGTEASRRTQANV